MRDQAAIGIGTMIVFLATALVAAVAAGILITAGSDVKATGDEQGFHVAQVVAHRLAPSDATLHGLDIYLVADGPVELDRLHSQVSVAGKELRIGYPALLVHAHHDPDGSVAKGVMQSGDIVVLRVPLEALPLGPGDVVSIQLTHGRSVITLERSIGLLGDALIIPL